MATKNLYSANQLYKMSGSDKPFKAWIEDNKDLYNSKNRTMEFDIWLNRQSEIRQRKGYSAAGTSAGMSTGTASKKLNADDGGTSKFWDIVNKVGTEAAAFSEQVSKDNATKKEITDQNQQNQNKPSSTGFLGLPTPVTIIGGLIIIGLVAYGVYKVVQKNKN